MESLYDYYRELENDRLSFIFNGDVSDDITDGITDQFSNDGSTKFGYTRIKQHLTGNVADPMADIQTSFEKEMDGWMGDQRQLDDMLFMGIRL